MVEQRTFVVVNLCSRNSNEQKLLQPRIKKETEKRCSFRIDVKRREGEFQWVCNCNWGFSFGQFSQLKVEWTISFGERERSQQQSDGRSFYGRCQFSKNFFFLFLRKNVSPMSGIVRLQKSLRLSTKDCHYMFRFSDCGNGNDNK